MCISFSSLDRLRHVRLCCPSPHQALSIESCEIGAGGDWGLIPQVARLTRITPIMSCVTRLEFLKHNSPYPQYFFPHLPQGCCDLKTIQFSFFLGCIHSRAKRDRVGKLLLYTHTPAMKFSVVFFILVRYWIENQFSIRQRRWMWCHARLLNVFLEEDSESENGRESSLQRRGSDEERRDSKNVPARTSGNHGSRTAYSNPSWLAIYNPLLAVTRSSLTTRRPLLKGPLL